MSEETPEGQESHEVGPLIWSDYPVVGRFQCLVPDCDYVFSVHATVSATVMMPEDPDDEDTPPILSFIPTVYGDGFELHMMFDHGLPVVMGDSIEELLNKDDEED